MDGVTRPWYGQYDPAVPRAIDYEAVTVSECFERSVARHSDRTALAFRNMQFTYQELGDQVARFAAALKSLGVIAGTRVAIQLPNIPQAVIAYFATLRIGGIAVMTNPLYTAREIKHQWLDAGIDVAVVLDYVFAGTIDQVRADLNVKHYVVASLPEYLPFPFDKIVWWRLKRQRPAMVATVRWSETVHTFRDLVESFTMVDLGDPPSLDAIAMLQYTGGTTGTSKGAMLTHRNISANAQQNICVDVRERGTQHILVACLPYFHIFGLMVSLVVPLTIGAAVVLIANPRSVKSIVRAIARHRATDCPAVPTMYIAMNQYDGTQSLDLSSLQICISGSAPLSVEILQRFESLTGARIVESYGLTETSPVTHINPIAGLRKAGSIGLPLSDTDVRLVDLEDETRLVGINEPGEMWIKGPQVMKGYWNRPEATDAAIQDGWLRTGDIAKMDEQGYFSIVGRLKDMILVSGYNVYPDEVDRVLMSHPDVSEAATIGIPDTRQGERVKSFVVRRPGTSVTTGDLFTHCRRDLAAYKVPREIEFREGLPKSTVLKVLRRSLREEELRKGTP